MAVERKSKRTKKAEKLNAQNAAQTANTGMNAAYTQSHGQLVFVGERDYVKNKKTGKVKDFGGGHWEEGPGFTSSKTGKLSTNGRTAGGSTWTFTDKENGRQSGRSKLATRRQRYYDVRVGLGLSGG